MEYAVNRRTQIAKNFDSLSRGLNWESVFPKTLDELWIQGPKLLSAAWPKFVKTDQEYQLAIEMPGVGKENVEVLLDPANSYLTVKVMGPCDDEERVALFHRTVSIPSEADISGGYTAKLDLGILTVTFPVDEDTQPRIIEVTVE